jgi:hypothetical protein
LTLLAALPDARADSWDFPLFLHIFGAMILVGALALAASSLAAAWRNGSAAMTRLGYRALLWAGLPAFLVMRLSAEWIADKEGIDVDNPPEWIDTGYSVADPALLLLIIATVCAGIGNRRLRNQSGSATTLDRVALVLISISLLGYLFAIWAMTTKPT